VRQIPVLYSSQRLEQNKVKHKQSTGHLKLISRKTNGNIQNNMLCSSSMLFFDLPIRTIFFNRRLIYFLSFIAIYCTYFLKFCQLAINMHFQHAFSTTTSHISGRNFWDLLFSCNSRSIRFSSFFSSHSRNPFFCFSREFWCMLHSDWLHLFVASLSQINSKNYFLLFFTNSKNS
jgi:hypothetical protein